MYVIRGTASNVNVLRRLIGNPLFWYRLRQVNSVSPNKSFDLFGSMLPTSTVKVWVFIVDDVAQVGWNYSN